MVVRGGVRPHAQPFFGIFLELCSDVGKYKKIMQHILKDTAKNTEAIFVQTVNTSGPYYHHLFETFRDEVLLPDAETGAVTDADSLLTFSNLNETPSATQQMAPEDSLFLFNFDIDPTENPEEINLAGIDQLPTMTDDQIQEIRDGLIYTTLRTPET